MTVIALDRTHIAVDRQSTTGDTRARMRKWRRLKNGGVALLAGTVASGIAMIRWLDSGKRIARFPMIDAEDFARVIVVHEGHVVQYESSPHPLNIDLDHGPFAWGSGRGAAWGAMRAGAPAAEAVEIASEYHIECGMGVDVFDLHGNQL